MSDRPSVPRSIRRQVIHPDSECWLCGWIWNEPESEFELGHIIDVAMGGASDISNLAPMHGLCNYLKPFHKTAKGRDCATRLGFAEVEAGQ